ncbi:hypothetical protein [Mucilaginibacter sp. OK098]|nr:hypothetical protein [Mucilaginibacter sp. OK098]SHN01263.1 hypothetical protein SAMN05216524_104558 [Mucilaginibacter sp. OK098]
MSTSKGIQAYTDFDADINITDVKNTNCPSFRACLSTDRKRSKIPRG